MRLRHVVRVSMISGVAAVSLIVACGGGDDSDHTGAPDAKVYLDAAAMVDAPGSGGNVTGLGQTCTPPAQGSGQGDCPTGYVCLALTGATHPWCSKTCTAGSGDTCAMGYTGPGVAGCIMQVSFNSGPAMSFCGITCAGMVNGCTTTTCNGTCPSQLACSATLMDTGGNTLGSACQ